jgi:hypothetical protein
MYKDGRLKYGHTILGKWFMIFRCMLNYLMLSHMDKMMCPVQYHIHLGTSIILEFAISGFLQ